MLTEAGVGVAEAGKVAPAGELRTAGSRLRRRQLVYMAPSNSDSRSFSRSVDMAAAGRCRQLYWVVVWSGLGLGGAGGGGRHWSWGDLARLAGVEVGDKKMRLHRHLRSLTAMEERGRWCRSDSNRFNSLSRGWTLALATNAHLFCS